MRVKGQTVKVEYEETYKDAWLSQDKMPTLNHVGGYSVTDVEVLKAGRLKDGREFQTLRVILQESA